MNMLSEGFPQGADDGLRRARPRSNAHGPNEFLHVPYARKLTAAVAQVLARMP
jgi:acetylornithine deacetylase/succinyl-diaminopimelate desuccinylase-like protein